MLLSRKIPFPDIDRALEDMTSMFDIFSGPLGLRSVPRGAFPAISISDTEDALIVTAEIPGINPDDIELSVLENSINIKGSRNVDQPAQGQRYYRRERPAGEFDRTVSLAEKVDPEAVTASCKNGILTVKMPKAKKTKARTISIKSS